MRTLHICFIVLLLGVCLLSMPRSGGAAAEDIGEVIRLHQSGDSVQALLLADKLLTARPKDAQLRFSKGLVLAESHRTTEAIDVFQKLTEDFPELAEPHNNLAALHAARGEYDLARLALEQALRSNPRYATAQENLGDVYAMLASRAYARASALDPGSNQIPRKLELVRELLNGKSNASAPKSTP